MLVFVYNSGPTNNQPGCMIWPLGLLLVFREAEVSIDGTSGTSFIRC